MNNMVNLARAIHRQGIFKGCLFNARDTLHIERDGPESAFVPSAGMRLPYEVSAIEAVPPRWTVGCLPGCSTGVLHRLMLSGSDRACDPVITDVANPLGIGRLERRCMSTS